jgi:hypothetical protein
MKLMRGRCNSPGKKGEFPREVKPTRVAVSLTASAVLGTRTLAGSKTLKWRFSNQPQEGIGIREDVLLCGWK